MGAAVGSGCAHRKDLFHAAPVKKEGEACPASCGGDDVRWHAGEEELYRAANPEAVAEDMCEVGRRPEAVACGEE